MYERHIPQGARSDLRVPTILENPRIHAENLTSLVRPRPLEFIASFVSSDTSAFCERV